MKKIILLLSILLFSFDAFTQDYIPLVMEGTSWLLYSYDDVGENPEEYWNFLIKEDTLINSQTYNKVILRKVEPVQDTDTYKILDESLFALLREEVNNRKVFCIKLQDYKWGLHQCVINEEFLLYDFSYDTGDELVSCNTETSPDSAIVIQDIKDEFLYNETRTVLDYNNITERWIEGVGHSSGIFRTTTDLLYTANTVQSILQYCIDSNECGILLNTKSILTEKTFKLYPNPVSTILNIESERIEFNSLRIFDALGRLVLLSNTTNDKIDVQTLDAGIHFIEINFEQRHSQYLKFLKL